MAIATRATEAPAPPTEQAVGDSGSAVVSTRHPMLAVALLGVMSGIQAADPTIASTALVESSSSLGMIGGVQALAASISTLILAGTVVSTGLLADRIGRRKLLAWALALSIAGDLLTAIAPFPAMYLLGRSLAGIGLGAVFAAAFAFLRAIVPPSQLTAANGTFAAVGAVAMIGLAFLGGVLASVNWRFAFLVVPVSSALALGALFALLPKLEPTATGRPDAVGQALLAGGVVLVLYGVSVAGGGLTKPTTWVPILVGVVLLVAWLVQQDRSPIAFFPVRLFRDPLFLAAITISVIYNLGQAVVVLQTANLWQYVDRLSTTEVALGQWPYLFATVIAAFLVGRWTSQRLSLRAAATLGGGTFATSLLWMAGAQLADSYLLFVPGLVLAGFGTGFVQVVSSVQFLRLAPAESLGPVTSFRTTVGQIAYSIGLSVPVILMNAGTVGGATRRLEEAGASPATIGQGLDAIKVYTTEGTMPSTEAGQQALAAASRSYSTTFSILMVGFAVVLVGLTIAASALMRNDVRHTTPQ